MTAEEIQQLQALLFKSAEISLGADKVMHLQFSDCTLMDVAFMQQLQARAQAGGLAERIDTVDYSVHFAAVEQSRLFKRANPSLALMQVAKAHALDLPAFKRAFLARKI